MEIAAIILAAGKSTRMQLRPKAALPLAGRLVGKRVADAVGRLNPQEVVVVVGHEAEAVKEAFGAGCKFVLQRPQLGTAHALLCCAEALDGFVGDLLVVSADHPLLAAEDLARLVSHHRKRQAAATLLTGPSASHASFGRLLRDEKGRVVGIVEARDATPEQLALPEVNLSIYCFSAPLIFRVLRAIRADNAQKEFYLTDAVGLLVQEGRLVEAIGAEHRETCFGINTPEELARAEAFLLQGEPLE